MRPAASKREGRDLARPRSWQREGGRRFVSPSVVDLAAYAGLLQGMQALSRIDFLILDFRRCLNPYPDGMVPLLALCDRLRSLGHDVKWLAPEDERISGLFDRMRWSTSLGGDTSFEVAAPARYRTAVPAIPYNSEHEANQLCIAAIDVLISETRYAEWVPEALYWAMWEIMENPLIHAKLSRPVWFQAVTFRNKKHVNFVVVDTGIGILQSLRQGFPNLDSDRDAIRDAVEFGVTRDKSVGQGNGLGGCSAIAEHNGGSLTVWSGGGLGQVSSQVRRQEIVSRIRQYRPTPIFHQGTIVELELDTRVPIDLPDVLEPPRVS